jgi:23S rRNA pseudouridine1911/1915/1917 synthase
MIEPLVVLFEDAHCLAVVKPAGLLTQGTACGEPTLEAEVRLHLNARDPGAPYLGTVHRLDRPVSGVVVWAKTPKAARRLAGQFARHTARKEYWAIVEETAPQPVVGPGQVEVWDDWLAPASAAAPGWVRLASPEAADARRAVTRVQRGPASRLPEGTSWLRLWPATGRTHQLRVQAASRGCPILGDRAYSAIRDFPRGIALHARELCVVHPVRLTPVVWVAPLPELWSAQGISLPESPS